jgi:glycerol dehydrogenase-like iron-containing ADH family enzyme
MEQHRLIGKMCDDYGHARFEEGSEHFFAYCFEYVNGHTIMHGELGSLGVLIMSALQGNRPEYAREVVARAGVRHRPEELGITMEEIEAALRELPAFVARENHWYSIANDLVVGERELTTAREAIDF